MVSEFAVDLLKEFDEPAKNEDKPFFLWANFWGPHTPCFVPEPYYSMYDPAEVPMDPSFNETWERKPTVHDLYERIWGLRDGGWAGWREIIARYWGYCTMIDDLVGNMLEALKNLGLDDNTIVVFTTDHGDQMGAHRMIEKGPFAYEESWRLPLVAAHPDCENPGTACDEFVYLHDLYATFLDAAGLPAPETPDRGADCETRSILPNLLGQEASTGRDCVYGVFTGHILPSPMRFLRTRTHKFVFNHVDIGELYDLRSDPDELYNLIDLPETKELQDALMERMHEYMVGLDDPIRGAYEGIRYVY